MLDEMIAYHTRLETLVHDNPAHTDWQKESDFFQTQLAHLQLERLMHLLVTLAVGMALLISCFATILIHMLPLYILDGILMLLFLAYILHYRTLENTTQHWYALLATLKKKSLG